jgi:hypothetical protein
MRCVTLVLLLVACGAPERRGRPSDDEPCAPHEQAVLRGVLDRYPPEYHCLSCESPYVLADVSPRVPAGEVSWPADYRCVNRCRTAFDCHGAPCLGSRCAGGGFEPSSRLSTKKVFER